MILYEICNAKIYSKMLTSYPYFSVFMPCKISIYENDNNTFTICTPNMISFIHTVKDKELLKEFKNLILKIHNLVIELSK